MSISRLVAVVRKERAEDLRRRLRAAGLIDASRRIVAEGDEACIPIVSRPPDDLDLMETRVVEDAEPVMRSSRLPRLDNIAKSLQIDSALKSLLPRKWERIGDVLILRFPSDLDAHKKLVAEAYARVLGASAVLRDVEGIAGDWRLPNVEKILGGSTETVHVEDGVRFKLDPAEVMFSSGNLPERMRMARACRAGEIVVDLFAGIGYFSVPMAVHSRPKRIFACEINPTAFRYLEENVRINRVETITPLLGDCRQTAPEEVADRVVMGYLRAQEYLSKAFAVLGREGVMHYHEACPESLADSRPWSNVRAAAREAGREVELLRFHRLKSYAPNVTHVVLDVGVFS